MSSGLQLCEFVWSLPHGGIGLFLYPSFLVAEDCLTAEIQVNISGQGTFSGMLGTSYCIMYNGVSLLWKVLKSVPGLLPRSLIQRGLALEPSCLYFSKPPQVS